jgi:hypothetical protein
MNSFQKGFSGCLVAVALGAAPALAQSERDRTVARLVDMHGNVLVSHDSGLSSGAEDLRLTPGTRVLTTAHSDVVVEYDDGCRVHLKENQRFEVEHGKPCALLLAQNLVPVPAVAPFANTLIPAAIGGAGIWFFGRGGRNSSPPPPVSPN